MDNSTEPLTHEPQETRPTPLVRRVGRIVRRLEVGLMRFLQNPILLGGNGDSVERLRIRDFVSLPRGRTDIRVNLLSRPASPRLWL